MDADGAKVVEIEVVQELQQLPGLQDTATSVRQRAKAKAKERSRKKNKRGRVKRHRQQQQAIAQHPPAADVDGGATPHCERTLPPVSPMEKGGSKAGRRVLAGGRGEGSGERSARNTGDRGMVDIDACSIGEGIQSGRHACRGLHEYVLAA
jgi:hypothetical protein